MMWTTARLTTYIGAALAGIAFILASVGAGTYDPATGMFDLHPVNVYLLAGIIAGPAASALAALAVAFGWGKK